MNETDRILMGFRRHISHVLFMLALMGRMTLSWGLSHCHEGSILYTTEYMGVIRQSNNNFSDMITYVQARTNIFMFCINFLYQLYTWLTACEQYRAFKKYLQIQVLLQINHISHCVFTFLYSQQNSVTWDIRFYTASFWREGGHRSV